MTQRERHRQNLLWTIHRWMRRYGVWFVFVLYFSMVSSGTVFAADPAKLVSKELERAPMVAKETQRPKVEAVKKLKIELPSVNKEDAEAEGEIKTLKGKVAGVNNFGVAVEYNDGAREMWADLMKETKLDGVKKFRDLEMGDTVELTYKELKNSSKRLLQKVRLIRRAPKDLEAVETEPVTA